jgi:hypothetical protein
LLSVAIGEGRRDGRERSHPSLGDMFGGRSRRARSVHRRWIIGGYPAPRKAVFRYRTDSVGPGNWHGFATRTIDDLLPDDRALSAVVGPPSRDELGRSHGVRAMKTR